MTYNVFGGLLNLTLLLLSVCITSTTVHWPCVRARFVFSNKPRNTKSPLPGLLA